MLQKLISAPALGAVLLLSTVVLLVQNTELGLASNLPQMVSDASLDPSSNELFNRKASPTKLASAVAVVEAKKVDEKKSEPVVVQVASQTAYKPIAPSNLEAVIRKYATEYGANPEVMMIIAKCESGFRADAVSPSGAYHGMYQFVAGTWQSNRRAMGLDDSLELMHDAEEAIKTAAFKMGRDGYGAWPVCSQKAFSALAEDEV